MYTISCEKKLRELKSTQITRQTMKLTFEAKSVFFSKLNNRHVFVSTRNRFSPYKSLYFFCCVETTQWRCHHGSSSGPSDNEQYTYLVLSKFWYIFSISSPCIYFEVSYFSNLNLRECENFENCDELSHLMSK